MPVEFRILSKDESGVLAKTAPDVFDNPVDARWSAEFLADPRHHLAVALDGDTEKPNAAARRLYTSVGG